MSVQWKIPDSSELVACQFFQIPIGCSQLAGYIYDSNTKTLYAKENDIIIPNQHGLTHISEDPVPEATCDTKGLMSADDKCKLDSMLQMRLGILGFQGAGFSEDGGYLSGDVILAAGSEFMHIERVGNTIRFCVDSPIPLTCCESCAQIYWIQDESESRAIRPPSCNGIMPNVSAYGELKIYMLPESTVVDPNDPLTVLNTKGQFPTLQFRRYNNALTPYEAQLEMVLKRNANYTTNVGWSFTPNSTKIECVWYLGVDKNGAQVKMEFWPEAEPGILGSILYRGNLITKKPAIVVDYTANILSDNLYVVREWDVKNATTVGSNFNATNVWRYLNPTTTKTLVLDSTVGLLPIGTVIDLYQYEITRVGSTRTVRSFFVKEPNLNPANVWSLAGAVQFGDLLTAREEINDPVSGTAITASESNISDIRLFERTIWGLNNFKDLFMLADDGAEVTASDGVVYHEPSGEPINNDIVADIDATIPGLKVTRQEKVYDVDINGDGTVDETDLKAFACAYGSSYGDSNYDADADFNGDGIIDARDLAIIGQFFDLSVERISDRPVFLWHRGNHKNVYLKTKIGYPASYGGRVYPPYDFLVSAPVDNFDDVYTKVTRRGIITTGPFNGMSFIVVKGMRWKDLPAQGVLRILTGAFRNCVWRYAYKTAFSSFDDCGIMLIGAAQFPFDDDFPIRDLCVGSNGTYLNPGSLAHDADLPTSTTVVELLRQDFTAPAVRFQFGTDSNGITLQLVAGTLDMSVAYPLEQASDPADDLVRGFSPGYTVSAVMTQTAVIEDGVGADITSDPADLRIYRGGELPAPTNGEVEKWNDVEIMYRDNQLWVWINELLISPDSVASSELPYPVVVTTPYFPVEPQISIGKVAIRMFPGAIVRAMEVRDQTSLFNEFYYQQIQLV